MDFEIMNIPKQRQFHKNCEIKSTEYTILCKYHIRLYASQHPISYNIADLIVVWQKFSFIKHEQYFPITNCCWNILLFHPPNLAFMVDNASNLVGKFEKYRYGIWMACAYLICSLCCVQAIQASHGKYHSFPQE